MSKEARYPISDERMKELLDKYPFLMMRNESDGSMAYGTESENISNNYYKYWDGHAWEDLWKNRYLPRLFRLYDGWSQEEKNAFRFLQVKEKFGELRIYASRSTGEDSLEGQAGIMSRWICSRCGAEPRDARGNRTIRVTDGWVSYLCPLCASVIPGETDTETAEDGILGGYCRFSGEGETHVSYRETADGWLERAKVETVRRK